MTAIADFLLALAALLAGRHKSGWIAAVAAEAEFIASESDRLQWALGAFYTGLSIRASVFVSGMAIPSVLLFSAVLMLEWRSGLAELVLPVSWLSTTALSFLWPGRASVAALTQGAGLPAAHLVADLVPSLRPWYQYQTLTPRDWVILVSICALCAVVGCKTGVKLRRVNDGRQMSRSTR